MHKLLQECKDKELGVDQKDGNDPVNILRKLKYRPTYIGSILFIGADEFQLQYLLTEQTCFYKEFCRLLKANATVCLDSTVSLVTSVNSVDYIKAPTIFLFEIVVNFNGITLSVGQMLSAKLDTNTILFWLNNWLIQVGIIPKQAVVDYSKALLGGISFAFNTMSLKSYVRACFLSLINPQNVGGPAATFISIDVAHLMAIFCRLKCFNTDNKAVKDFFIRCVALMVSCEDFLRFQEILLLTLTISIHSYDGEILNSSEPSPAEKARLKLINLIGTESHNAMKLIIDEESDEYKNMTKKNEC